MAHRRGQHPYPTHAGGFPAACPAATYRLTYRRRNRTGAWYPISPSTNCWPVPGPVDLQAQPNQFRGVDSTGLRPHPSHVCIHRRNSDAKFSTDLRVGESAGEVREHILFPRGQLRELCQVPPLTALFGSRRSIRLSRLYRFMRNPFGWPIRTGGKSIIDLNSLASLLLPGEIAEKRIHRCLLRERPAWSGRAVRQFMAGR